MAKTGKDVGGNGKYAVAVPDNSERVFSRSFSENYTYKDS